MRPGRGRGESVDRRALATLSLGHLSVDFVQGAIPALLVFLKPRFGLSYVETAAIVLVATSSSSLTQPLFGLWSDRRGGLWLLPAGVGVAAAALGAAVVMPSYAALLACVFVSGLGVGAFHPEGAKHAALAGRARPASSISIFALGGSAGLALGPAAASVLVLALGLRGALLLALPCLIVAALLWHERGHFRALSAPAGAARAFDGGSGQPGALGLLLGVVALRSVALYGLLTFVPLWEVAQGHTPGRGALLLALLLAAGAVGTLLAGPAADRIGGRLVLRATLAATGPLIAVYLLAGGVAGAVALVIAGATTAGTLSITTLLSQQYLPGRVGMASGLSMGFSIGLGGVAAFGLGVVADAVGLRAALLLAVLGAVLGAVLALALPAPLRRAATTPNATATHRRSRSMPASVSARAR